MTLPLWFRDLAKRFTRPSSRDVPPPLDDLGLQNEKDRRRFLEEVGANIRHRERLLRMLEAKAAAKTYGGTYEGSDC
jgi:hypothetical protein